jgi:ubiquinone/menaquinone biosynthesis C-methylase UbiE
MGHSASGAANPIDHRPAWQLPPGVSRGTWDYVVDRSIATEYDQFHGQHPLLEFDQQIVAEWLSDIPVDGEAPPLIVDLGCGTGRLLERWNARGWRTLGIDLSREMLQVAKNKIGGDSDCHSSLVQANLTQLDWLVDKSVDAAVCLYSSIGMIRGREHRQDFMVHVARFLKPKGLFIVHVHNRGNWLTFPHGWKIAWDSWWQSRKNLESDFGDRIYPYRGLPSMFLHIYSLAELKHDLRACGFDLQSIIALNKNSSHAVSNSWLIPSIRAGGFIAIASPKQLSKVTASYTTKLASADLRRS